MSTGDYLVAGMIWLGLGLNVWAARSSSKSDRSAIDKLEMAKMRYQQAILMQESAHNILQIAARLQPQPWVSDPAPELPGEEGKQ